jgi:NADPH-dependent glutamate synthase beta subunit-like oxidoreductase
MTRVAILGSGISAMYCAANVLKRLQQVRIDIFEARSYAYGLLNSGVSPMSAEFKLLSSKFDDTLRDPRVSLFLDKSIHKDDPLLRMYDYVIDASGGKERKHPKLPYDQGTYYSASRFTGWYNGRAPLPCIGSVAKGKLTVAIIGYGNVSLDLADYFLTLTGCQQHYAFSDESLQFKHDRSFEVYIVGRKNIDQSSFTTAELKKCLSTTNFTLENDDSSKSERARFARSFA